MFIKSKIQFSESKSQQRLRGYSIPFRCLSSQRYNFLKANHNSDCVGFQVVAVVYQVKDTIFWKQITTHTCLSVNEGLLFIKSKIQFSESKSQRHYALLAYPHCCLSSQRYNFLKANHNLLLMWQLNANVVYQVKDTIFWKQITTNLCALFSWNSCLSSQRYNFLKANHNGGGQLKAYVVVVYQVKDTIFWKQITTKINTGYLLR